MKKWIVKINPVAEQFPLGTLVQEFVLRVDQAHGALADDGQAGRRTGLEYLLALRVVGDFQLARQRPQVLGLQGVERQNRVEKLGGEVYVVHGLILTAGGRFRKQAERKGPVK